MKNKLSETTKLICEAVIIACLLLINVVMGNFARHSLDSKPEWTIMDRVFDAFTVENICIALTAGFISSFLLWHIVRK